MSLSIHNAEELSKLSFIGEINILKKDADAFKPLSKETEERILQKFRLDWNYHSNAIEGNKLTYGETVAFLMEGVTAKAKPLKDHLDIKGHDEAVRYLISLVKEKDYLLSEADIRNLHKIILKESYWVDAVTPEGLQTRKEIKIGEYKSTSNHVKTPTGEIHYYATPEQTPIMMGELMQWCRDAKADKLIHPLILASLFHHQFVSIHPFDDGNGRMARLLMNLLLMQEDYPPIVVRQEDRQNYYQVLRQADAGELIPICEYMSNLLKHSLNIYIKGAKGESIAEEDDVDKEIKLFVKSKITDERLGRKYSKEYQEAILSDSIVPLIENLFDKIKLFEELFTGFGISCLVYNKNGVNTASFNKENFQAIHKYFESFKAIGLRKFGISCYFLDYKFLPTPFIVSVTIGVRFDYSYYLIDKLKKFSNEYNDDIEGALVSKFYGEQLTKKEIEFIIKEVIDEIKNAINNKVKIDEQEK
jgi:Fic family protein